MTPADLDAMEAQGCYVGGAPVPDCGQQKLLIAALRTAWASMAAQELKRLQSGIKAVVEDTTVVLALAQATVTYIECPVGHGRLHAANWVDHGCLVCDRDALAEALRKCVQARSDVEDCEAVMAGETLLARLGTRK